jgi:hypothetical protein
MAHHGPGPFEFGDKDKPEFQRRQQRLRDLMNSTAEFRGALGEHTHGHLTKDDEGAIQFAIGERDGKVVIDFGTPVHWLGMTPQQAADFASAVLRRKNRGRFASGMWRVMYAGTEYLADDLELDMLWEGKTPEALGLTEVEPQADNDEWAGTRLDRQASAADRAYQLAREEA